MINKYFILALILGAIVNSSYAQTISGSVSDSVSFVYAGHALLFKDNGANKPFIKMDSVAIDTGYYFFNNVSPATYYVLAVGDTADYPDHLNTYYGQTPQWENASQIVIDTGSVNNANITLIQKPNWSGSNNTGYCSGTILFGTGQRAGDPIPGIDVALEQIPGGIIKASTTTDENGFFEITKIPNNTQYGLLVDIPGYPMDSTHTVTIMNGDTVVNLNFALDTSAGAAGIYVKGAEITSIQTLQSFETVKVYPNPSSSVFYVECPFESATISVFDISGKMLVSRKVLGNAASISLNNYPSGLYFMQVQHNQTNIVKRLIKY